MRQLEHEWIDAFLRADTETLDSILADDFIFTDPQGNLLTKAEWIADLTSGELTFESIHIDDLQVRMHGDACRVSTLPAHTSSISDRRTLKTNQPPVEGRQNAISALPSPV